MYLRVHIDLRSFFEYARSSNIPKSLPKGETAKQILDL